MNIWPGPVSGVISAKRLARCGWLVLALAALFCSEARGQVDLGSLSDQELIDLYESTYAETLRDSVIDDSELVGVGRTLVQFGYTYTSRRNDGLRYGTHTVPELLIRRRFSDRIELRAGWSGVTFDRLHDEVTGETISETDVLNPSLGGRFRLWRQHGVLPETSLTASTPVDLDRGTSFLARFNPQASLGYSWLPHQRLLISGTTGAVWIRDLNESGEQERFLDLQQSLSFDWLITDRLSLYLLWTALIPEGARVSDVGHSIGPGISLPLISKTQLDFSATFGLNDQAPKFGSQVFLTWSF